MFWKPGEGAGAQHCVRKFVLPFRLLSRCLGSLTTPRTPFHPHGYRWR